MATITSFSSFDIDIDIDIDNLDLNILYSNAVNVELYDGINYYFRGHTYPDLLEINYTVSGYNYTSVFGGENLVMTGDAVTGGTVTGYADGYTSGNTFYYYLAVTDVSLSAAALFNAGLTSGTADDIALITDALSGDDTFLLSSEADKANGLSGDDLLSGAAGNDRLLGGSGSDTLDGGSGRDKLLGGTGADTLEGGAGKDRLLGQKGQDTLEGGAGNDFLDGGTGFDLFIFADNGGHDTIHGFHTSNREKIDLSQVTGITGFRDLANNHIRESGGEVIIDDHAGTQIVLQDLSLVDLGKGDFIF